MVGAQRKCAVQGERPVSARNGHSGARRRGTPASRCARRPGRRRVSGRSVLLSGCHHRLGGGVRCGRLRDIEQSILCGTAFQRHDQIGVRGQRVVQAVADRRQSRPRPRCPARPGMGRHGSVRRPNPVASPPDGVATRTETTGEFRSQLPHYSARWLIRGRQHAPRRVHTEPTGKKFRRRPHRHTW